MDDDEEWTAHETAFSDPFVLTAGQQLSLDLVAPNLAGRNVSGNLIASDGGPLGGTFVFATDSAGHQNGNYFSSMDWGYVGPFDIGGLRQDSYVVDVNAMGCNAQAVPVNVAGPVSGVLVQMVRET
ncbi:MAG: hypothetical protein ACI8QC_001525 [Planctomycetota bacterium]|jgi:hypothetical protein